MIPTLARRYFKALRLKYDYYGRALTYGKAGNFIYRPVPKVACTSWFKLIQQMENPGFKGPLPKVRNLHSGLFHFRNMPVRQVAACLADPSCFKFAFVRHPETRLKSAFEDKLAHVFPDGIRPISSDFERMSRKIKKQSPAAGGGVGGSPFCSYPEFVRYLAEHRAAIYWDRHWCPQARILRQDLITYDFIGKFENMREDSAFVLGKVGHETGLPLTNRGASSPELSSSRQEEEEISRLVRDIYREDFETFGYD